MATMDQTDQTNDPISQNLEIACSPQMIVDKTLLILVDNA